MTNYVDQQTLQPDDDYVLPHQRLWTFNVLGCPLSATERFLLQPLICGTVFHRTSLLPPVMVLWDVLCNGNVGLVGLSNVNILVDDHTASTALGGRCPEID